MRHLPEQIVDFYFLGYIPVVPRFSVIRKFVDKNQQVKSGVFKHDRLSDRLHRQIVALQSC